MIDLDLDSIRRAFAENFASRAEIGASRGATQSHSPSDLSEATQTILFDPPGITTALGGAMYTHVHHSATLRHSSGGWKVIAFEPKVIDIGEVRRR